MREVGSPKDPGKSLPPVPPMGLPPPQEFGRGNPFMLFLCLAILLEHRDHIMRNGLDYNELAMHLTALCENTTWGASCAGPGLSLLITCSQRCGTRRRGLRPQLHLDQAFSSPPLALPDLHSLPRGPTHETPPPSLPASPRPVGA